MYTIRDFDYSDHDYQTIVALRNIIRPEAPRTEVEWRFADSAMREEFAYHRDFIVADDDVIAFAEYGQNGNSFHPQKYHWSIAIHPDHDKTAVYAHYFEHVMRTLAGKNLIAVTTQALDDKTVLIDYLQSQNFVETMRFNVSELDVNAFDLAKWADAEQHVADQQIDIRSLSDIMEDDAQWQHKLYELDWLVNRDMPSSEPPVKSTFEQFHKANIQHPKFEPDFWLIAVHDGAFVGFSQFWSNYDDKDLLKTGDSGVIREFRRKGVVTALKIEGIRFAKTLGVPIIRTTNASINPMYQINVKLGFKLLPSWVEFEKTLD